MSKRSKFRSVPGTKTYSLEEPVSESEIVAMALRLVRRTLNTMKIRSFSDIKDYLMLNMAQFDHEVFEVIYLNNSMQMISREIISEGTVNTCAVYSYRIVKRVVELNATAVIFAHNHCSQEYPQPSESDLSTTRKLVDALALIDVSVVDHLIVGKKGVYSIALKRKNLIIPSSDLSISIQE